MHGGHALERPARDVKEGALTTAAVLCAHARRAARETQRDIMAARDLVRTAGVCVAQAVSRGWDRSEPPRSDLPMWLRPRESPFLDYVPITLRFYRSRAYSKLTSFIRLTVLL